MLKIAICDDEKIVLEKMEKILWNCSNEVKLEWDSFLSGKALLDEIKKGANFDLIFLDIEMGELSGIDVADILRNEHNNYSTQIAFVTSKENRAKEACKVQPLDFIDKPCTQEDIQKAIDKTIKILGDNRLYFEYTKLKKEYEIPLKDIYYFEAKGRKIKIISTEGEDEFYETIKELEAKLNSDLFIKAHQSYLVNKNHIVQILKNELLMTNEKKVPVSRNYKKNIK